MGKSTINGRLMGKSTISMVIFNSYVKLPEGNKAGLTWKKLWKNLDSWQKNGWYPNFCPIQKIDTNSLFGFVADRIVCWPSYDSPVGPNECHAIYWFTSFFFSNHCCTSCWWRFQFLLMFLANHCDFYPTTNWIQHHLTNDSYFHCNDSNMFLYLLSSQQIFPFAD